MVEALARLDASDDPRRAQGRLVVLLVESQAWLRRLPFHRWRQVLILSAGRHAVQAWKAEGIDARIVAADTFEQGLTTAIRTIQPSLVLTARAAEYAVGLVQQRLRQRGDCPVEIVPDTRFLVERFNPIPRPVAGKRYVMEPFYRAMRKAFGLLIESDGQPTGGAWNYDSHNRKRLPPQIKPPHPRRFEPDRLTREVMREVAEGQHGQGVGRVDGFDLAVTPQQTQDAFQIFLDERLPNFGPFEDAMSQRHDTLFHSVLSAQMNLGLLDPLEMARAAEQRYREGRAPLSSVEGFIRQIIGWREYILWQYRFQMPDLRQVNYWGGTGALPRWLWDGDAPMNCLRKVTQRVIDRGFSHHIERLMLVCNFCLLAGIDPGVVADWFLTFYVDSHDWVVLPNVLGMGLNADGGVTATKPYISSANYINTMSDYCAGCRFNPKARTGTDACPFNTLYWNFLIEHEAALRANPRLGPAVLGLKRLSIEERESIRAEAARFLADLPRYGSVEPGPDGRVPSVTAQTRDDQELP